MRAIITVAGKDTVGIIAKVSQCCTDANANIEDITQKVFDGLFVMIMLVTIDHMEMKFTDFVDRMNRLAGLHAQDAVVQLNLGVALFWAGLSGARDA